MNNEGSARGEHFVINANLLSFIHITALVPLSRWPRVELGMLTPAHGMGCNGNLLLFLSLPRLLTGVNE